MVTEVAFLYIRKNDNHSFEQAFSRAQNIIGSMQGHMTQQLLKCAEQEDKYLLLGRWQKAEDHLEGFIKHKKHQE